MKSKCTLEGFGAPKEFGFHHFRVEIPASKNDPVLIVEDFGLAGGDEGVPYEERRAEIDRKHWPKLADAAKREFNSRLRARKLPVGRWQPGCIKVERLLGKELCVLAWACEGEADCARAIERWQNLAPEERWWLFTKTAAEAGRAEERQGGWRRALRAALGNAPLDPVTQTRRRRPNGLRRGLYR